MSNGAVYDENGKARVIHDHKLEALEDLIEAANGQPVLVAYWFKHDRERIINHLSKLKIKVRDIKSSTDIKDWNAGNIPVALIHPASAGHGLNIQQILFFRTKAEMDAYHDMSRKPEDWTAAEIEQQRSRFCSVWQVIEEAELVDEYEAWKEANPNA